MKSLPSISICLILGLLLTCRVAAGGESRGIPSTDRFVIQIDKSLDQFTWSSDDQCEEGVCTRTAAYRNGRGRLQKTVVEERSQGGPGAVTARYFRNCNLVFVRVTPNDTEAVKNIQRIEKFYIKSGKIQKVLFGDEPQHFGKDQIDYYQRTFTSNPLPCDQKP